jgi:putative tryptophan/tyrosine transport system substrate-binding protein
MRRREFIAGLAATSVSPGVARAQQPGMPVIGLLNNNSPHLWVSSLRAFHQGLREAGYVEGQNVAIAYRWADDQYDRLPALAADLVRRQVAVITTNSTTVSLVAKAATATIPIVFGVSDDPVKNGLVASLNRPGGNLTGATSLGVETAAKLLEQLHKLLPSESIGLLVNPSNRVTAEQITNDLQAAAPALGLQLHVLHASSERDFDAAFATLARLRAGGLVIAGDPLFGNRLDQLAALALRHAMPSIYPTGDFTVAGGLMSYGGGFTDAIRLAGVYTGRILKGEKPGDLPVQQATKIALSVNLKTAKALGLTIPETLLATADEVIQ